MRESLIRELHKLLVKDVRGNRALPGLYRNVQNYVANGQKKEIIFTPPEPFDVPLLMQELIEWLQQDKVQELPQVLVAGIAQFQLVHIHPFLDGNGRASRLLSTLWLYRSGYDFRKLFTISEYYDRDRTRFYEAIQSVRTNQMDMTSWLGYFTEALKSQMIEVQGRGTEAMKLDILSHEHRLTERQQNVLHSILLANESFDIQDFENLYPKVSRRSLQRDLSILVDKGLIMKVGAKRNATYSIHSDTP